MSKRVDIIRETQGAEMLLIEPHGTPNIGDTGIAVQKGQGLTESGF